MSITTLIHQCGHPITESELAAKAPDWDAAEYLDYLVNESLCRDCHDDQVWGPERNRLEKACRAASDAYHAALEALHAAELAANPGSYRDFCGFLLVDGVAPQDLVPAPQEFHDAAKDAFIAEDAAQKALDAWISAHPSDPS